MAKKHQLETTYALSSSELLDAVNSRFRLKVALEGAVAEVQMEKHIKRLVGTAVESYQDHDTDGHPDFSIWLPGEPKPLLAECKNIRESGKVGGEAYREKGKIVAYKVETQKTRASKEDPTSRYYNIDHFQILGVCMGKKTGDWTDFLFARTDQLLRQTLHPHKLAVLQRVPLPDTENISPWYSDLGELIKTFLK